jgi:pimeloyl-ACP methyl ester carboxylesterase
LLAAKGTPVIETLESRQLIALDGGDPVVRGTYHRAPDGCPACVGEAEGSSRVGILFLNSLTLPRAATGDSSVYWADAFARCGYPSFRIDLPGLGDTEGELPLDVLHFINSGEFASVIARVVAELGKRFDLAGVVIVGHCAGAVSAIYAAAATPGCQGLVLMDPYFHLRQAVRPWIREQMSAWARRSSVGRTCGKVYDRLGDLWLRMQGNQVPRNANSPLLRAWKQVAESGLPILLLKAPGLKAPGVKPRPGEFDYVRYVVGLAKRKSRVSVIAVEGTDHSFANRTGREAICRHTETWLATHFPVASSVPR